MAHQWRGIRLERAVSKYFKKWPICGKCDPEVVASNAVLRMGRDGIFIVPQGQLIEVINAVRDTIEMWLEDQDKPLAPRVAAVIEKTIS